MHTPTAFILRRADSPSYFNPGDSPSHHLSHPLTAGPHTLSKHISFFLCCFLYFFIFSLLSFLPSVLLSPPLFFSSPASHPSFCQRFFSLGLSVSWLLFRSGARFSFAFFVRPPPLYIRPFFISCDTFATRIPHDVRHCASPGCPYNRAAEGGVRTESFSSITERFIRLPRASLRKIYSRGAR